ncbi:MAG: 50S ribosomal protein L17 [Acidobacteria bacterium]|nr:50S ribosomal protein L17 [Acidobacteriota bacterium]
MRHRKGGFKLQRDPSARRALLRGLATNVILRDRVVTTVTKAKAVRPWVEKMITLAKRDTLHSRRQAAAFLQTPDSVKKLFDTLGPRFAQQPGGYTRIVRLGRRKGDGAEEVVIEILGTELRKRAEDRRQRREERLKQQQEESAASEAAVGASESATS